jgi:hypothetical protein
MIDPTCRWLKQDVLPVYKRNTFSFFERKLFDIMFHQAFLALLPINKNLACTYVLSGKDPSPVNLGIFNDDSVHAPINALDYARIMPGRKIKKGDSSNFENRPR